MRINNNLMAMNTHRMLGINQTGTARSIEKLSSGYRINRAGDDAAGLAISEKMRGQIRGLNQASRNSQDAISLIQTAEGALNETHDILQRMRELAVQSANDTNVAIDRDAIQNEITQLSSEVNRIGNTTEFNTKKLLNGGAGLQTSFTAETVATVDANWMSVSGGTAETQIGNVAITAASKATGADSGVLTVATTAGAKTFSINGTTLSFTGAGDATDNDTIAALINANSEQLGVTATTPAGATLQITNTNVGSQSELVIIASADTITAAAMTSALNTTSGLDATVSEATISNDYVAQGNTITVTDGTYEGMILQLNGSVMSDTAADNDATFDITANGVLAMQIGANENQQMSVSLGDMRSAALSIDVLDVTTTSGASSAITIVNDAISSVSSERAKLGAVQNRLEHTIKNLDTSSENLQASESRIRDVDMAKEMMEFTKYNILQQAAQSMLAQANNQPQGILQLLR